VIRPSPGTGRWTRYFVTRKEVVKTTWIFKAALIVAAVGGAYLTEPLWADWVAESLVCQNAERLERADAILIDYLDPDLSMFGRASQLQAIGLSAKVIAPVDVDPATGSISTVAQAVIDVQARQARIDHLTTVPASDAEPYSLNTAFHIRQFAKENRIASVILVTPAFRSKRSMMIYAAVLAPAGVSIQCAPVFRRSVREWTHTWHGIQDVALQFIKLQYYRWYVMPFRLNDSQRSTQSDST
jgi:hypothetical protein